LEAEKLIVRKIPIEGVDDPLAIQVGIGIRHRGVVADLMSLILRVSRERQPQTGHALAESW